MDYSKTHKLTMYNDHVNSYEYVMAYLIRFCKHDPIQAEQCASIAHNNGKCNIKLGSFIDIFELHSIFEDGNIKTKIEEYETNESSLH